jgi:hypothetical protein
VMVCAMAGAQTVTTTTVQGTVYLADGTPGAGTVLVSWPAFTTDGNQQVAAGSTVVTVGTDGFLSVNLAPNAGSNPAGLYYTAVFHLADGTVSTQFWVVPAASTATLASVQAKLMPAAQAVQTVKEVRAMRGLGAIQGSVVRDQGTEEQGSGVSGQGSEKQKTGSDSVGRMDANGCDGGTDSSGQGAPEPGGL